MLSKNISQQKKAFSIIELSFLMTIVSLLALAYFATSSNAIINNSDKINITKERMKAIENAIINFQAQYGRLPCGAPIDQPLLGSNGATLLADDEYLLNTTTNGNECNSAGYGVPTRILSLPVEYALDAWNNKIAYIVCPNLCGNNSNPTTKNCTMASYQKNEGCISIRATNSGTILTFTAAYALISYGANGYGARTVKGARLPDSANSDEATNYNYANNPLTFISKAATSSFDDIVYFKTKNQINAMATDTGLYPISRDDCIDNSLALASIKFTTISSTQNGTNQIREYLTVTERTNASITNGCRTGAGSNTYNCGDEAVLGIMWVVQDICAGMYGLSYSCPGGGNYSSATNSCTCANNSWAGPGGC